MANRREHRQQVYLRDILSPRDPREQGTRGYEDPEQYPPLALYEDDQDQVLYVPDVLVVGPTPDDIGERVRRALEPYEPRELEPLVQGVHRYELGRKDQTVPEVLDRIAAQDPEMARGSVAPEYVFVLQQKVHPGEDPEMSGPVPPPDQARASLGGGVTIAVIDTGLAEEDMLIDPLPQCLDGTVDRDGLIGVQPFLGPAAGHATFISNLILQVAPGANVVDIKVAGPMGYCRESDIVLGLRRAAAAQPDVINLSLGMYGLKVRGGPPTPPLLLQAAIDAVDQGTAIVASAGNDDSPDPMYPAAFDRVVGVAALDCCGRRWAFSNYGPWVKASALGQRLRAAFVRGEEDPEFDPDGSPETWRGHRNWAEWSGTSFAAPLVAAQIALVKAASPVPLSGVQAQQIVLGSSGPAHDPECGRQVLVHIPGAS